MVWLSIPTGRPTCGLHSFVSSCLYMLFNFLFSYREYEDLLWFYRSKKSLYFFLNKKRDLKVLALNDSTRIVNILSPKHWKSSVILHAIKWVSEVTLFIKQVFHFQPLGTQSFWLQFWCWYFPAEPVLGLREIFFFYFIFKLYIIVLVLPNIKMNPPQVYMCSPSRTLLPLPSPYHPSGPS